MKNSRFWLTEHLFIDLHNRRISREKINPETKEKDFDVISNISGNQWTALRTLVELYKTGPVRIDRLVFEVYADDFSEKKKEAIQKLGEPILDKMFFDERNAFENFEKVVSALREKLESACSNDICSETGKRLETKDYIKRKNWAYTIYTRYEKDPWTKDNTWVDDTKNAEQPVTAVPVKTAPVVQTEYQNHTPRTNIELKSVPILTPSFVDGSRDDVFEALDKAFAAVYDNPEKSNVVIIHGVGGSGKTRLTKIWANKKLTEEANNVKFNKVVIARFDKERKTENNFRSLIINDNLFALSGFSRDKEDSNSEWFIKKLAAIMQSEDRRTLIILDNYETRDLDVEKLLKKEYGPFDFSLILISRAPHNEAKFENIPVRAMKDKYLVELFRQNIPDDYYHRNSVYDSSSEEIIKKMIALVGGHTLAVEILSKGLSGSYDTLCEYYKKLFRQGGHIFEKMQVAVRAGDWDEAMPVEIIRQLFRIADLEKVVNKDDLKETLVFFYGIPVQGIETEVLIPFIKDFAAVKNILVKRGWLEENEGVISMHALVRETVYSEYKTDGVLKIENCSKIINEIMKADGDYESALYHKPWEYKQKIGRLYQSIANIFPYNENNEEELFWFYNRLRLNLGFCNQWEMQANIFSEMLSLETDEWKKAYLTYRTEQFPTNYWRKDNYIENILTAAKKMEDASCDESLVSDREKMELANLYRYVGSAYCNLMTPYPKRNTVKPEVVEEIFKKGENIVKELLNKENPSKNALLYSGTISVWRAQLYTAFRQIIEARSELYKANKIFADYGYINKVDKAAIFNGLALLNRRVGNVTEEAKYLKRTINIFEKYFGVYNRPNVERHIRLYYAYADEEDGFYANESAWDNAFYTIKKAYKMSKEIDYMYLDVIEIIERDFSHKKRRPTTPEIEEEYNLFLKEVFGGNNN